MTTFNYNDYYKQKIFGSSNCCPSQPYPYYFSQQASSVNTNVYVQDTEPTVTSAPTLKTTDYYPTFVSSTGYGPLYIDDIKKPVTLTYTAATPMTSSEFATQSPWQAKINMSMIDFSNVALKNISNPTDLNDCVNKQYVDASNAAHWWEYPALGTIDISNQILDNAKIRFSDNCLTPILTPEHVLVLTGNNTSHGRFFYNMVSDIERFEIFNMAPNGIFYLVIKGDPTQSRKIKFCGNGINYIYTSWQSEITVGSRTYMSFQISHVPPDILMHMHSYN